VKVMPKKRVENIIQHLSLRRPHTRTIHHQIIWYSASLLIYGWFLSWIAYDILIWHKPITQVSITNYAGAIIAMALIWAGTKIFKLPRQIAQPPTTQPEKPKEQEPEKDQKPEKRKIQHQEPQPTPQEQPQTQLQTEPQPPKHTIPNLRGCKQNLSYLHEPENNKEIPDHCLTCTELLKCLNKTNKYPKPKMGRAGFEPATFGS
jgi:hypothetical protein